MHPFRNAWSKNGQNTVESKKGSDVPLGNKNIMTAVDIGQLNTLYKCNKNLYPVCYQSLGIQDGRIQDSKFSASSFKTYHQPNQARLHLKSTAQGNGAWCPSSPKAGQYLTIDLGSYKYINGIATQGFVSLFGSDSWVTHFNFHFSYTGADPWYNYATWYPSGLSANYDASSVQYNKLPIRISARYIRIFPTAWVSDMCMRVEIYGCNYY
ncbi:Neurexin-4 [Exaiptasia diaphana]|nr:Neurexin-4 [Exaiptasia diaphana]